MVRTGPTLGVLTQIVLMVILAHTVGLGVTGWVTGVGYGVGLWAALTWGMSQTGVRAFGPANWVTLIRATLVGCVAALTADSFQRPAPARVLVAIAAVALVLDALDGQVARRTGTASAFGARFDMEVDAFLILVLSAYVARSLGDWVIAIGAMRYGFVVVGWALRFLRRPLPPRYWRKVVAATQGVVLVFAAADIVAAPVADLAVAAALVLLIESFGRDIAWLWLARTQPSAEVGATRWRTVSGSA